VFPVWQLPVGPFAQASLRARTQQLEIDVPASFRVLAVGREKRSERRGDSVIYRFEMLGAEFPPYVIAGRYQERRTETRRGTVVFWTRELLDEQVAGVAAKRLAGDVATYQQSFGPVSRNPLVIHIVETSAEVAPIIVEAPNISAASFPGGVLFDRRAIVLGLASDAVLDLADYELARTWFGWHVRPKAEVDLLLGRGMALFAAVHAAEARGGSAVRQQEMARLIGTYEGLGPVAEGKPGFGPTVSYNRTEQAAKAYKGALFLFALEDIAGEENSHRAVRRILADLAGQEIGSDELRSAVEAEAGRNLAGVFHAWFDHSGIPAEFRSRYAATQ
jgi:aminopeptidase N